MKIFADANPIYASQLTGVGYFTDQLLGELAKIVEVEGFAFNFRGQRSITRTFPIQEQRRLPGKLISYPRYLHIDIPLSYFFSFINADVVLGTNYLLPPTGKKPNVATVHDLCFMDHPMWVQGRNAHVLRNMVGKTLERSSGLLTISKFSAERIRDIYDYQKPIEVINIPPKTSSYSVQKPKSLRLNKDQTYFLYVGTIEPRKNLVTLLDAYELLDTQSKQRHPLVLAGRPGWDPEVLDRLRSQKNPLIIYLDYVSEPERNWLYKNALATIVPSHYEGFGMMTLESLEGGTPVITSNIPPQREILGDSGVYFDALDSAKLNHILHDFISGSTAQKIFKEQKKVLANYSWKNTAQQVLKFLSTVIE